MYSEFVGLTPEVVRLIEAHRTNVAETKNDILLRVLSPPKASQHSKDAGYLDLGQGAKLRVGEPMFLFLSKEAKDQNKPDGVAEVRQDGIYIEGNKVRPSKGSPLHPAMQHFQNKLNHRNDKGELVSLSAWRQWHVLRNSRFVSVYELKDQALAHRRGRKLAISIDDLDIQI